MKYDILLVEDDYLIRQGLKKIILNLSDQFNVELEASNGKEALEILKKNKADLVITDVKMPQMDGIALVKKLSELYPELSIVMLSGYNDFEYVRQSLKSGALDYLNKPVETAELKKLLDSFVASQKLVYFYGDGILEYNSISYQTDEALKKQFQELHSAVESVDNVHICHTIDTIGTIIKEAHLEPSIAKSIFINLYMKFEHFYQHYLHQAMDTSSYAQHINRLDRLETILDYCQTFYCELAHSIGEAMSHDDTQLIQVIKRYVAEHYREQITLSVLSKISYTSSSYLCNQFKTKTGQNIMNYVNLVRIDHAKKLLKDIRLKTYQIAELVGYSDPTYFSRVFKSIVGMSPSEYRNKFFHD